MNHTLFLFLLVFSAFCIAESDARAENDAADFFKNPSAKRSLIKLLNSSPLDQWSEHEGDLPSFNLDAEFGVLATTGNTSTQMLKLALDSQQELRDWSNRYFMQILQRNTKLNDEDFKDLETNRLQMSAQLDHKLSTPTNRLFVYAEYDDNQFLQLRDQYTAVIGWSQLAWKKAHTQFRYSVGPGYARYEQGDTELVTEEMIIRATANYDYDFENDAKFRQTISAEMGQVNKRARSKTSVSAKIFKRLAMRFSFEMALDENVSANVDSFSTQTSISMVYQFF